MNTSVTLSILSPTRPSCVQRSDSTRSMWTKWGKAWVPMQWVRSLYKHPFNLPAILNMPLLPRLWSTSVLNLHFFS